jgi:hypothetical protein
VHFRCVFYNLEGYSFTLNKESFLGWVFINLSYHLIKIQLGCKARKLFEILQKNQLFSINFSINLNFYHLKLSSANYFIIRVVLSLSFIEYIILIWYLILKCIKLFLINFLLFFQNLNFFHLALNLIFFSLHFIYLII